jgi:RND superfamily putative drug exporter
VVTRFRNILEPKRSMRTKGWRKIGAAIVRWPGPVLVATIALSLVGLLALPATRPTTTIENYLPRICRPGRIRRADRHFSQARMNPELLMVESDHDLRNSADFLVIDKIAKALFRCPGGPGAGHHPAAGHPDRAHLDPVPDQHAGYDSEDEREVPAGHDGQHAQTGR